MTRKIIYSIIHGRTASGVFPYYNSHPVMVETPDDYVILKGRVDSKFAGSLVSAMQRADELVSSKPDDTWISHLIGFPEFHQSPDSKLAWLVVSILQEDLPVISSPGNVLDDSTVSQLKSKSNL